MLCFYFLLLSVFFFVFLLLLCVLGLCLPILMSFDLLKETFLSILSNTILITTTSRGWLLLTHGASYCAILPYVTTLCGF